MKMFYEKDTDKNLIMNKEGRYYLNHELIGQKN